jgi:hypothetical protein
MKKRVRGIYAGALTSILLLVSNLSGYGQDVAYTYGIASHQKHNLFYYLPPTAMVVLSVFFLGVYLIYHYWHNGKLIDDLS